MLLSDLNGGEIIGSFYEKELQKTYQKKLSKKKINGFQMICKFCKFRIKKVTEQLK